MLSRWQCNAEELPMQLLLTPQGSRTNRIGNLSAEIAACATGGNKRIIELSLLGKAQPYPKIKIPAKTLSVLLAVSAFSFPPQHHRKLVLHDRLNPSRRERRDHRRVGH
jgi:hypothetical protein